MRQWHRRCAADPPPRAGSRRNFERIACGPRPAPQQQHRRASVGGGQLEPPCGGLIGGLHFRHHRREAAVAQTVLGKRERHDLVPAFAVEQFSRRQPGLFEPGRIEIEPGQRPGDTRIGLGREARCGPGGEQSRGGIITQRRRGCADLVQAAAVKAAATQPCVDRLDPERQQRRTARHRQGDTRLQLGEQACAFSLGKGGIGQHKGITTRSFPLCSGESADPSSANHRLRFCAGCLPSA